jgi:predicted GNAT family acetyltransferase
MNVTRYETAAAFLEVAEPLLLIAEGENNLLLGIAQGLARSPSAATNAYLATVGDDSRVFACAVHIPPFKLVITRADREPIVALARHIFEAVPELDGVTGPSRSADDFALAWGTLSGIEPTPGMRLRIHEARKVMDSGLPTPAGRFRAAVPADLALLTAWTKVFVSDARISDPVDASQVVEDAIRRGRLHVWEDAGPVSMAAWAGKTPSGVRINFVYTPRDLRGKGYGSACVKALTCQQLEQGNAFCWLYTDVSSAASPDIFKRIGYRPVSDVSEYYFKQVVAGAGNS